MRGMLRYFGEEDAAECGKCDVCRARRRRGDAEAEARKAVEQAVVRQASRPGGVTLTALFEALGGRREPIIEAVRALADAGTLHLDADTLTLV